MIKIQCEETGVTGVREAIVCDTLLQSGAPVESVAALVTKHADSQEYDARFPDHPLSRLRRVLSHLEATLQIDAKLKSRPPFVFHEKSGKGNQP